MDEDDGPIRTIRVDSDADNDDDGVVAVSHHSSNNKGARSSTDTKSSSFPSSFLSSSVEPRAQRFAFASSPSHRFAGAAFSSSAKGGLQRRDYGGGGMTRTRSVTIREEEEDRSSSGDEHDDDADVVKHQEGCLAAGEHSKKKGAAADVEGDNNNNINDDAVAGVGVSMAATADFPFAAPRTFSLAPSGGSRLPDDGHPLLPSAQPLSSRRESSTSTATTTTTMTFITTATGEQVRRVSTIKNILPASSAQMGRGDSRLVCSSAPPEPIGIASDAQGRLISSAKVGVFNNSVDEIPFHKALQTDKMLLFLYRIFPNSARQVYVSQKTATRLDSFLRFSEFHGLKKENTNHLRCLEDVDVIVDSIKLCLRATSRSTQHLVLLSNRLMKAVIICQRFIRKSLENLRRQKDELLSKWIVVENKARDALYTDIELKKKALQCQCSSSSQAKDISKNLQMLHIDCWVSTSRKIDAIESCWAERRDSYCARYREWRAARVATLMAEHQRRVLMDRSVVAGGGGVAGRGISSTGRIISGAAGSGRDGDGAEGGGDDSPLQLSSLSAADLGASIHIAEGGEEEDVGGDGEDSSAAASNRGTPSRSAVNRSSSLIPTAAGTSVNASASANYKLLNRFGEKQMSVKAVFGRSAALRRGLMGFPPLHFHSNGISMKELCSHLQLQSIRSVMSHIPLGTPEALAFVRAQPTFVGDLSLLPPIVSYYHSLLTISPPKQNDLILLMLLRQVTTNTPDKNYPLPPIGPTFLKNLRVRAKEISEHWHSVGEGDDRSWANGLLLRGGGGTNRSGSPYGERRHALSDRQSLLVGVGGGGNTQADAFSSSSAPFSSYHTNTVASANGAAGFDLGSANGTASGTNSSSATHVPPRPQSAMITSEALLLRQRAMLQQQQHQQQQYHHHHYSVQRRPSTPTGARQNHHHHLSARGRLEAEVKSLHAAQHSPQHRALYRHSVTGVFPFPPTSASNTTSTSASMSAAAATASPRRPASAMSRMLMAATTAGTAGGPNRPTGANAVDVTVTTAINSLSPIAPNTEKKPAATSERKSGRADVLTAAVGSAAAMAAPYHSPSPPPPLSSSSNAAASPSSRSSLFTAAAAAHHHHHHQQQQQQDSIFEFSADRYCSPRYTSVEAHMASPLPMGQRKGAAAVDGGSGSEGDAGVRVERGLFSSSSSSSSSTKVVARETVPSSARLQRPSLSAAASAANRNNKDVSAHLNHHQQGVVRIAAVPTPPPPQPPSAVPPQHRPSSSSASLWSSPHRSSLIRRPSSSLGGGGGGGGGSGSAGNAADNESNNTAATAHAFVAAEVERIRSQQLFKQQQQMRVAEEKRNVRSATAARSGSGSGSGSSAAAASVASPRQYHRRSSSSASAAAYPFRPSLYAGGGGAV